MDNFFFRQPRQHNFFDASPWFGHNNDNDIFDDFFGVRRAKPQKRRKQHPLATEEEILHPKKRNNSPTRKSKRKANQKATAPQLDEEVIKMNEDMVAQNDTPQTVSENTMTEDNAALLLQSLWKCKQIKNQLIPIIKQCKQLEDTAKNIESKYNKQISSLMEEQKQLKDGKTKLTKLEKINQLYVGLDDELTRLLFKVDSIQCNGFDDARNRRKHIVKSVQNVQHHIDNCKSELKKAIEQLNNIISQENEATQQENNATTSNNNDNDNDNDVDFFDANSDEEVESEEDDSEEFDSDDSDDSDDDEYYH